MLMISVPSPPPASSCNFCGPSEISGSVFIPLLCAVVPSKLSLWQHIADRSHMYSLSTTVPNEDPLLCKLNNMLQLTAQHSALLQMVVMVAVCTVQRSACVQNPGACSTTGSAGS